MTFSPGETLRTIRETKPLVHRRHGDRVLRGQRDERARAVAAGGRERLQVGLDAGPPARVGGRDGEATWNGHDSLRRC